LDSDNTEAEVPAASWKPGLWVTFGNLVSMFFIVLVFVLLVLSNINNRDSEAHRRGATEVTSETETPPAIYAVQSPNRTCYSDSCTRAALNVTLNAELDPCKNMYGYVCESWARSQRLPEGVLRRITVDQAHQDVLSSALHALMVSSNASLPRGLLRIYQRCLEPAANDSAILRSQLLDNVGLVPWPLPRTEPANPEDVSQVIGNAFYFTNEPVLLQMGVNKARKIFLAEPTLLRDAPTADTKDVARASRIALANARSSNEPLLDVNEVEDLLDINRRGDVRHPWNTVMLLPKTEEAASQAPQESSNLAGATWDLRIVLEEAFEPSNALRSVVLRAPAYTAALPTMLEKLTGHQVINYLGLRTALLASRMLQAGEEKDVLCRVLDWDDLAPAKSVRDHCVRLLAKYEPTLSLYALVTKSSLLQSLDMDALVSFMKTHLQLLLGSGGLEGSQKEGLKMAALVEDMAWRGLAPSWLRNASLRRRYVKRFYKVGSSSRTASSLFHLIQEKAVNEHMALNDPAQFIDANWKSGLLSTRPRVLPDDGPTGSLELPLAAFDLLWATHPDTASLQLARVGVRAFESVLRYLYHKHRESCPHIRSSWVHEKLDVALESRALSFALHTFLAWPMTSDLRLPGLEMLSSRQLFFIFYTLHQCEMNSPDMEKVLSKRWRRGRGSSRPAKASWLNRLVTANMDFANAFGCRVPALQPNPFKDCA
ncbi:unnamed protein product, partial [Ixodes pacificus]